MLLQPLVERGSAGLTPHGRLHNFRRLLTSLRSRFVCWALTVLRRIKCQRSRGTSWFPFLVGAFGFTIATPIVRITSSSGAWVARIHFFEASEIPGSCPSLPGPQLLSAAAWQCAGHLSSSLSQSGTRFSISTSLAPAAFPRIRDRSPWLHCYLPSHFHLARSHRRGFSASFSSRVEALVRFNRFCDYLLLFPALCWSSFPFSWPAVDSTNAPNYGKGQPKPVR